MKQPQKKYVALLITSSVSAFILSKLSACLRTNILAIRLTYTALHFLTVRAIYIFKYAFTHNYSPL